MQQSTATKGLGRESFSPVHRNVGSHRPGMDSDVYLSVGIPADDVNKHITQACIVDRKSMHACLYESKGRAGENRKSR